MFERKITKIFIQQLELSHVTNEKYDKKIKANNYFIIYIYLVSVVTNSLATLNSFRSAFACSSTVGVVVAPDGAKSVVDALVAVDAIDERCELLLVADVGGRSWSHWRRRSGMAVGIVLVSRLALFVNCEGGVGDLVMACRSRNKCILKLWIEIIMVFFDYV